MASFTMIQWEHCGSFRAIDCPWHESMVMMVSSDLSLVCWNCMSHLSVFTSNDFGNIPHEGGLRIPFEGGDVHIAITLDRGANKLINNKKGEKWAAAASATEKGTP